MPRSGSYYYPINSAPINYPVAPPMTMSVSSTFLGDQYTTILPQTDVLKWSYLRLSVINNSVNNLQSGSVEVSPNGSTWEVINTSSFMPLTSSGITSVVITGSHAFLRFRAFPSGSAGGLTGSLQVVLVGSNG